MNKSLLSRVKKKKKVRNILTEKDYKMTMEDFIMRIYEICTPNKYGDSFPEKLVYDVGPMLKKIPRSLDRGDLHVGYKKFMEAKISYLGLKDSFSITNIRDWQQLDYFILCFVDGEFNASFYCVPKEVVTDNHNIRLTGMNNSKKINSSNTYVGKRTTIKSGDIRWLFKEHNILAGTTYKHLFTFLKNLTTKKTKK
jgi:hypothetical protein